jgi:DNA polymerase III epsilon subunit-like protein
VNNYGIIIDLETGGLDPERCAVTEIGAVAFSEEAGTLIERMAFHANIKPPEHLDITREAAKVQGKTVEDLYGRFGQTEGQALVAFAGFFYRWFDFTSPYRKEAHRIWAHYAGFDQAFLTAMVKRNEECISFTFAKEPMTPFSCTLRLFQQQQAAGLWPEIAPVAMGGSLGKLCEAWGIDRKEPHDALSDCRATLAVLDRLQKRMRGATP